ncbi:IS66 family insertion sequence element accessory protein TnpB [Catenovulum sediminis]|uniref:IS66 family insertion sequence element accessory protein TnpB n=1 Tax=Catenovulum sediminis TaxID=1740262 RepID=A0ABV1RFD5_9ALTE|nr:IS66 family insertion sequence element accessory protein TnpB [Catenovulum sediminis]
MLQLSAQTAILLATQPQDFRKGIDGFVAVCRDSLQQNPRADIRFVFINKSRTMLRVLTYDGSGYWLMTKRLSKGRFQNWPNSQNKVSPMLATELRVLLKGEANPTYKKV